MIRGLLISLIVVIIFLSLILLVVVFRNPAPQVIVVTPTPTPTPIITITPSVTSTPSSNIIITSPLPNQLVSSPLTISGKAVGNWFFEAVAPVKLVDGNGNILSQGQIGAQGDWQTNDFVPFIGELTYSTPNTNTGQLIFNNDNPSGLPQNNQQFILPIRFR